MVDGHLTPEPVENIYSGVVSLRNLRLVIFSGKLNDLDIWGADIGNAYLEAFTDEKLNIVAGPEFEELERFILIFLKALYGLESSGKRWAEVIHDIIKDMKLFPSKADSCIWLRKNHREYCYEYIAVYVDDLCIAAENPEGILNTFKNNIYSRSKEMANLPIILVLTTLKTLMVPWLANLRSPLISQQKPTRGFSVKIPQKAWKHP